MSEYDIFISLDRLTRFKYPLNRIERVYGDIIFKNLKAPKLNRHDFYSLNFETIQHIATEIWNESIFQLTSSRSSNYYLNEYLAFADSKIYHPRVLMQEFNFESETLENDDLDNIQKYLNLFGLQGLNITSAIEYFEDNFDDLPDNLKRLVLVKNIVKQHSNDYEAIFKEEQSRRFENKIGFPIEKVILTEGVTEEILLPLLSQKLGFDFMQNGIKLISAGGKNQVARLYNNMHSRFKIPIFILLDADAKEVASMIKTVIEPKDKIYIIESGEFEDILPINLIQNTIYSNFKNIAEITEKDLKKEESPMVKVLYGIWRENGFGDFKKAEFAHMVAKEIADTEIESDEISKIVKIIENL